MLIPDPGGIQWDFIEICRLLLSGIDYSFMHDFFKLMNIPSNLRFLYLDHILVPINLRYSKEDISQMLKEAGAINIIRYQRDLMSMHKKNFQLIKNLQLFGELDFIVLNFLRDR